MNSEDNAVRSSGAPDTLADAIVASPSDARPNRYNCQSLLGASLASQKRYADGEPLLVSAYTALKEREAGIPRESRIVVDRAGVRVVQLYTLWGKAQQASEWRRKLPRS